MALLLNLLYKTTVLYLKQPLYVRILTLVCVLGFFAALAPTCQAIFVVEDVADVVSPLDNVAVEKVSRTLATSTDTSAAPARAPLCSDLPCRMRDPEYVRRYVHNLSSGRAAREASELAFQKYYVTHQGGLHKREVFIKVER
jgi:hypothetical protein